jgi:DNA-binding CsgD family transcriptional regulator
LSTEHQALGHLRAARDAGGAQAVLRVLAEHWDELLHDHPKELLLTLDAMSVEALTSHPQLVHYRRFLLDQNPPDGADPVSREGSLEELRSLTRQVVAARTLGRISVAAKRADTANAFLRNISEASSRLTPFLPPLQYEWAETFVQAGRFTDALGQFIDAHEAARDTGDDRMARASAGGAALMHAVFGRGREAQTLLTDVPTGLDDENAPLTSVPGAIAHAWRDIDRLEYDRASDIIARVEVSESPAYWVPYYIARTTLAAAGREGPQTLLAHFDTFLDSRPTWGVTAPGHVEAVGIVRHLLLRHLERPEQALKELSLQPASHRAGFFPQLQAVTQARHLLTLGHVHQARQLVRPLLNVESSRPRILIPALLLAAETDGTQGAEVFLRRAAVLAQWHGHYSPLLYSSPDIRHRVAEILSESGEDIGDRILSLPSLTRTYGTDPLSDREREVVELAMNGLKIVDIASHLHVSPNTVKSHLFRVYRKLEISTKKQLAERIGAYR